MSVISSALTRCGEVERMEAALAYVVQNEVEAAYARSDLFERRRRLTDDWSSVVGQAAVLCVGSAYTRGVLGRDQESLFFRFHKNGPGGVCLAVLDDKDTVMASGHCVFIHTHAAR